jgi:trimethylamine-N-oxide reductase (cytochrome c)
VGVACQSLSVRSLGSTFTHSYPFHHHQDTNNLVKAWRKPQTVIVHEPYWTATAKHADIVLPVTTSYERNDLEMGGDYSQRYVFPMHQCVPPQFEARNDFDIFSAIAAKLGVQEQYTEGKDEMLWLKQMYDGMAAQARGARVALPPFNMFWEANNYIRFPIPEANRQWIRHADFRENPLLNPLGTPSGKIEIFSNTVAGMGYADCAGHPKWYEPKEWVKSETADTELAEKMDDLRARGEITQRTVEQMRTGKRPRGK